MKRYGLVLVLVACSGGDDGVDAPMPAYSGYVQVESYDAMDLASQQRGGLATAGFSMSGVDCTTVQTVGACVVMDCPDTDASSVSGGTVTITGAAEPITLTPSTTGHYDARVSPDPLFNGGETLTFTASGGDVPGFTKTIKAPSKPTITQPAKPASQVSPLVIDRSKDLMVAWTGGGNGTMDVSLAGAADRRVSCRFDTSTGHGKVPSAALSMLTAGMGGVSMAAFSEDEVIEGDWGINVGALYIAVWPDASMVSGPTMFQ